ncbi:MAG: divergent PAP2 family protein [Firmicutes bacterium]|nr:divergent PAP2 family protein [Bacillota bacterium]
MTYFTELFDNKIFVVAFVAWFMAQLIKVVLTLLVTKKFDLNRFVGSGGMPSSHTSFVMGLSTAIGLEYGWNSNIYAFALTFALIVMYDASGVRRSVGKQATILNTIIEDLYKHKHVGESKLKELVGHTPFEVIVGAVLGIFIANMMI